MNKESKKRQLLVFAAVAAVAVILAAAVGIGLYNTPANRLKRCLNLGNKYLTQQQYAAAIVEFEKAIKIDPMCEKAYIEIVEAYLLMGKSDKAIEYAMQGYSQIGDVRFLEKAEEIQALADIAVRGGGIASGSLADIPGNIGSQEISEEDALYGERVVDGVYHNGYAFYDLSKEEAALLDELISYTEEGRYEEYAKMVDEQAWKNLVHKYHKDYMQTNQAAHIAYKGYKICTYNLDGYIGGGGGGGRSSLYSGVCLIPIEDGMGALYAFRGQMGRRDDEFAYAYCECVDGMFNGTLWGKSIEYYQDYNRNELRPSEVIEKGEVVNGLLDGRFSLFYNADMFYDEDVDGDGFVEVYSTFDHGKLAEFVEFGEIGNGGVSYSLNENGKTAGYMEVSESFEKTKDVLLEGVYYILPFGYYQHDKLSSLKERRVGDEQGVWIYPY